MRTCYFWNCSEQIPRNHFLCSEHHHAYRDGFLNKCEECGRWKYAIYDLCRDCEKYAQQPAPRYQREHSEAWEAGDANATGFFVYILKLEGGQFYAGQTRELRERLSEHRDGTTKSTAGKNPKLVWFTVVPTRDAATELEADLKQLCDENPREVRRMVVRVQDLVQELDFS